MMHQSSIANVIAVFLLALPAAASDHQKRSASFTPPALIPTDENRRSA